MIYTILVLAIAFMAIATLIGWLVIVAPASARLKWVLIPATLMYAWYLAISLPQLMGAAFPGWPKGIMIYLDHRISGTSGSKHIEMWLEDAKGSTRLYSVPFNANLASQLDAAKAATNAGIPISGQFTKQGRANGGHSGVDDMTFRFIRPNPEALLPPKTP